MSQRETRLGIGLLIVLATVSTVVCGGGSPTSPSATAGGSTPSGTTSPTTGDSAGSFSTSSAAGEPSEHDWAMLSAQLSSIGIQAFTAALSTPGTSSAPSRVSALSLTAPSTSRTIDAAYLCCGESTTAAMVVASGTVTPGSGTLALSERVVSAAGTRWVSGSNVWTLALPTGGLAITANLVTVAGAVAPQQEFRLVGTITYSNNQIGTKTGAIDVVLGYSDFETAPPTATGQMGPARGTARRVPAPIPPQRCSRPREGCGPLVSGNAACNGYPTCPN